VPHKPPERLHRIKHRRRDLGFTSALLVHDGSSPQEWCVRVESPSEEATIVTLSGVGPLLTS